MHILSKRIVLSLMTAALALTIASPAFAQGQAKTKNGLPPCNMDSFVYQAGAQAEMIYGDEGVTDIPPLFGFTNASRINAGITGINDVGLTTGHGSYMPSATGADEFIAPATGEWSQSGANYGNLAYNNAADVLDATDAANINTPETAQQAAINNAAMNMLNQYNNSGPLGGINNNPDWP